MAMKVAADLMSMQPNLGLHIYCKILDLALTAGVSMLRVNPPLTPAFLTGMMQIECKKNVTEWEFVR